MRYINDILDEVEDDNGYVGIDEFKDMIKKLPDS